MQGAWNCRAVAHLLECGFYAAHGGKAVHFKNRAHILLGMRFLLYVCIHMLILAKINAEYWKKQGSFHIFKKMSENVLTKGSRSGNIIKLSARARPQDREEYKKLQKSLKKYLTKSKRCDII